MHNWISFVDDVLNPSQASIYTWARSRRNNISVITFNSELSAIRNFYQWGFSHYIIENNVVEQLPKMHKAPKKLPRYLEDDQISRLLAAPNLSTLVGFRDHVILRLIYETGITAGEVIDLDIWDIHYDDEIIQVRKTGKYKTRLIPISQTMCGLLKNWIQLRWKAKPKRITSLFVTSRGHCVRHGHAIWQIVNRYADKAINIESPYTMLSKTIKRKYKRKPWSYIYPTLLRNSFTVHLLRSGCDLRAVQIMLGHESVTTTAKYLELDIVLLKRKHSKLFKQQNVNK